MGPVEGEIPVYLTYLLYLRNTTSLPTYHLIYFHSWHWPVKSSTHPRPDYPVAATAGSERKTWERSWGARGGGRGKCDPRARAPPELASYACMGLADLLGWLSSFFLLRVVGGGRMLRIVTFLFLSYFLFTERK